MRVLLLSSFLLPACDAEPAEPLLCIKIRLPLRAVRNKKNRQPFGLPVFHQQFFCPDCATIAQGGMQMRQLCKDLLLAVIFGMVLPGILLQGMVAWQRRSAAEIPVEPVTIKPVLETVLVRDKDGILREMELDTYLTGVVLAEMPASFEKEALKAQAVAARTYTKKAAATGGKHDNGIVCMDPGCCQGYCSPEDYLLQGGQQAAVDKIRDAVTDTSGYVLTYEGELIEATYFSCSGGSTEDASAVWGTEYPYLQAVESPGEEAAGVYLQTRRFTPEAFQQALGVELRGHPRDWFAMTTYTEGGGVAAMTIGGQLYTGTQLRSLLGLRSTAFAVEADAEQITITTKGFGHRVGMSQYGADAMAMEGSSYGQILAHYYPGTLLCWMGSGERE